MGSRRVKAVSGVPIDDSEKKEEKAAPAVKRPVAEKVKKAESSKKSRAPKRKAGKQYLAVKAKIEAGRSYPLSEAIKLVKETSFAGFDASVELHVNLGLDPEKQEHRVRTTVALPHGTGKKVHILAFADAGKAKAILAAGADEIGDEALVEKIAQSGKIDFDVVVATPQFMSKLAKAARVLGPKGLMPSPKTGTISDDLEKLVVELKKGRIEIKTEKQPIIHAVVGKVSMTEQALKDNFQAVLEGIRQAKPAKVTGEYIRSVYLKSTMSPSVRVDIVA
jgi:large subunit ribosomal protein L1